MKKILVVDDDEDILMIVSMILRENGYDVKTHGTGLQVPEVMDAYKPDLVLLDVWLPGKSGTEICRDIKQIYTVKVVLFSAHILEKEALALCNADGFVVKPFDIDDLTEAIKKNLI